MRGRVGQLEPVELGLLPGRVLDDRVRALGDVRARRAHRPQLAVADLPGEGLIRAVETERTQLVPQRHDPQMRVLDQSGGDVLDKPVEAVRGRAFTDSGNTFPVQVRPDRLSVMVGAAGDLADRHPLPFQSVDVHAAPL